MGQDRPKRIANREMSIRNVQENVNIDNCLFQIFDQIAMEKEHLKNAIEISPWVKFDSM